MYYRSLSGYMKHELIIAADDYGIREASVPILALAQTGFLDRVAVLVRFVTQEEVELLRATNVQIDIHLELTRLLGRGEYEGDSFLRRSGNFFWHLVRGDLSRENIRREWMEQIEVFHKKFGRLPDGLNSHEHVHFFPFFFPIFLEVADQYDIRYVRNGRPVRFFGIRFSFVYGILSCLWWMHHSFSRRTKKSEISYLVSGDWIEDPKQFLKHCPDGKTEVVVHPERPREVELVRLLRQS